MRPPMPIPPSNTTRKRFRPSSRGSLADLVVKPSEFSVVAPESPRPVEMLSGVEVNKGPKLTTLDIAIHELLISWAYDMDKTMKQEFWSIPVKALTRFAGPAIRKDEVILSVQKLRSVTLNFKDSADPARTFQDVRMIDLWFELKGEDQNVSFYFPHPIRQLMRSMPKYAHLELAVIADGLMSTKWGPALYKRLLLESKAKEWQSGGADNTVFVQLTPDEIASAVGFPRDADGNYNPSRLTDFVLKTSEDLVKVRRFSTRLDPDRDIVREAGRGRRIRYYNFLLTLQPPQPYLVRAPFDKEAMRILGGADDPKYHIDSMIWLKAHNLYSKADPFHGWAAHWYGDLWLDALTEALDRLPRTNGYHDRHFRGEQLLSVIEEKGAEHAAWSLLADEERSPDLSMHHNHKLGRVLASAKNHLARTKRQGKPSKTLKKRVSVMEAAIQRDRNYVNEQAAMEADRLEGRGDTLAFDIVGAELEDVVLPSSMIEFASKIKVLLKPDLHELMIKNTILPLLDQEWSGSRTVLLTVHIGDEPHVSRIKPTSDEWTTFLTDIEPHLSSEVSYT